VNHSSFRKLFATMGEPWKLCKANLESDIVNGIVQDDWTPEKVHSSRDICQAVKFDRFKANLANLRQKMAAELDRAIQDDHAREHDEFLDIRQLPERRSAW
jgi:hypothetical protein